MSIVAEFSRSVTKTKRLLRAFQSRCFNQHRRLAPILQIARKQQCGKRGTHREMRKKINPSLTGRAILKSTRYHRSGSGVMFSSPIAETRGLQTKNRKIKIRFSHRHRTKKRSHPTGAAFVIMIQRVPKGTRVDLAMDRNEVSQSVS